MAKVCRLQLDVLKPHKPDVYHFSLALTELNPEWRICIEVLEIDQSTETISLEITGTHIDFELLQNKIIDLGATIHSIDAVETYGKLAK